MIYLKKINKNIKECPYCGSKEYYIKQRFSIILLDLMVKKRKMGNFTIIHIMKTQVNLLGVKNVIKDYLSWRVKRQIAI